jgi:CrcB protein
MDRDRAAVRAVQVALVAIGGFAGAVTRWGVTLALPDALPWGTLAANVAGSFLLGALVADGRYGEWLPSGARLLLATGFLSSFTTYSTFAVETAALAPGLGLLNVTANYTLGLGAALLGRHLAGAIE